MVMKDTYKREINYMRISVTDRCNLNCIYCKTSKEFPYLPHSEILTYEELLRLVQIALKLGIKKFRLTGGEPLLRKNITNFIKDVLTFREIEDFSLTTNGVLLDKYIDELWDAGLRRLNISLDSLNDKKYFKITGGGDLKKVLDSIKKALRKGFNPVKINVVLLKGINDDLFPFIDFAKKLPVYIRFIELMNFNSKKEKFFQSGEKVKSKLTSIDRLEEVDPPLGAGPAKYYRFPGIKKSIGFIFPYSDHFCSTCNRLRISADGKLRPCLFSDYYIDLKELLRNGATNEEIEKCILMALKQKPQNRNLVGKEIRNLTMREVGG
jgi:cyclic pyranopterin phosphate synthase